MKSILYCCKNAFFVILGIRIVTKLTNNKKDRDIAKIDFHFDIIFKLSRQFLYRLHSCNPYLEAQQDI
jgi:hypothetical protein